MKVEQFDQFGSLTRDYLKFGIYAIFQVMLHVGLVRVYLDTCGPSYSFTVRFGFGLDTQTPSEPRPMLQLSPESSRRFLNEFMKLWKVMNSEHIWDLCLIL